MEIKLSRVDKKLNKEVDPSLSSKVKLRDFLEGLYEGQQMRQQQRELLGYATKMKKDAQDKEVKMAQA